MRGKFVKPLVVLVLVISVSACSLYEQNPRAVKGAGIGAVTGAGAGAAIGAIVGGGKGAGTGAAIGAVVGALGGTAIGSYMDKQAEDMQQVLSEQDQLRRRQEELQVIMPSDVLYASGSATLQPGARQKLDRLAEVLQRYPRTLIRITGNTDSRGTEEANLDLSRRRAQAVAEELTAQGVSASRISTRGVGESMPIASNDTPEGRLQNRRVEIDVTPDQGLREEQGAGGGQGGGSNEPH